MTSPLPDLSSYGYELLSLITAHPSGGRATYLARPLSSDDDGERVVIKQFRFAGFDASWAGFAEQEREIAVLRELDHPRIPAYLDSFTTDDGFCLVQVFVRHAPIATRTSFDAAEVKHIALSVLEILVYLQERLPPVVHRDVKPANILADDEGSAYLVDFGLARAGDGSASTIAIGTPGFMAPEQLLGRSLTTRTDLFGLGATLISMLTGIGSAALATLIDSSMRFDLTRLPDGLDPPFVAWLRRMVEPEAERRFEDAEAARQALIPLDVRRSRAPTPARIEPAAAVSTRSIAAPVAGPVVAPPIVVPTVATASSSVAGRRTASVLLGLFLLATTAVVITVAMINKSTDALHQTSAVQLPVQTPVSQPQPPTPPAAQEPTPTPPDPGSLPCRERDSARPSFHNLQAVPHGNSTALIWRERLQPREECNRVVAIDAHSGALLSEATILEEDPDRDASLHNTFEHDGQLYSWYSIERRDGGTTYRHELYRLPELELVATTDTATLRRDHEALRASLHDFRGTRDRLHVDGTGIWLMGSEGHVWRVDALSQELTKARALPQRQWVPTEGPTLVTVSGADDAWLRRWRASHKNAWTGVRRLDFVECPRCRLEIKPAAGATVTTEEVYFDPRVLSLYHRGRAGSVNMDEIVNLPVPLLVEHATSLGGDARRQLSRVGLDGSISWTNEELYRDEAWVDDDVLVTHELTQPHNRHRLRAIDVGTGTVAWELDYPRERGRGGVRP